MPPFTPAINNVHAVHTATNKVYALTRFTTKGVSCPPWTTHKEEAARWVAAGETVVGRKTVTGSEGKGIVIITSLIDFPDCPLYTKYIKKKKEFRVHVVGGQAIDVQQKVRKRNAAPGNFYVRNTANGFVFHRSNIDIPVGLVAEAIKAVTALGLDFGAVDVVWNEHQNKSYVLEVNTAPGIEGSTVVKYKEALSALCNM